MMVANLRGGGAGSADHSTHAPHSHQRLGPFHEQISFPSPDTLLDISLRVGMLASDLGTEPNFRLDVIDICASRSGRGRVLQGNFRNRM